MKTIKSHGIITFDPESIKDPSGKMFKPWWMIIKVDGDIVEYYSWWLEKRFGIKLQRPAWGAHISVIRNEESPVWDKFKEKLNNKEIIFEYIPEPRSNGKHWWLKVTSDEILKIREDMGYLEDMKFAPHLTIGMPTPKTLDQSYYIWELYKKNLLNY